jgi:MMPL family
MGSACSARRRWVVIGAWVVLAVGFIVLVRTFGSNTSDNLEVPGTDSQAATDLLAERFPPQQNGSSPIVFHVATGQVTDSKNKQAIEDSHQAIVKLPHVSRATDPFSQHGAWQISKDKQTAFISVLLDVGGDELTEEIAQEVVDTAEPARKAGMEGRRRRADRDRALGAQDGEQRDRRSRRGDDHPRVYLWDARCDGHADRFRGRRLARRSR